MGTLVKRSLRVERPAPGAHESLREFATRNLREMIVKNELARDCMNKRCPRRSMSVNGTLQRQLQALNAQVQPYRYSVNIDRKSWERSMRDHDAIMDALRSRDPTALAGLLRQHLPVKSDVVRHAFASASALKRPRPDRRRNFSMADGGA
jgi:FCD domain